LSPARPGPAKFQLELPALEGHHLAAKIRPRDLPTIDDDQRQAILLVEVAINLSAHDPMIGDLQARCLRHA
jgi:hypothetical protein